MRVPVAITIVVALAAACTELPDLGVCGNGIVEADLGEACDGSASCTLTCEIACNEGACAEGQTCGSDNVCRAPSGMFILVGTPQLFDVSSMRSGDFDADGIDDLVGTSATQIAVLYGSSASPLTGGFTQDIPNSDSPPVLFERDVTNMNRSPITLAVPTDGIALLVSDDDTFRPKIDGVLAVDVKDKIPAVLVDPDPMLGDVVIEVSNALQRPITVKRADLPGVVAGLDLAACTTQNALVLDTAVSRDGRMLVIAAGIGDPDRWLVCAYRDFVLTRSFVNSAPPMSLVLGDTDADGCEEIVTARSSLSAGTTIVEYVDASGAGCTFATTPTSFVDGTLTVATRLLTAGSIIAGGRDELVLENGVYEITVGNRLVPAAPALTARRWIRATVTDLNRDGFGDVVAALRERPNLEIVRGGTTTELGIYEVDTAFNVTALQPGDFDGDGHGDVALVETRANGERISILYGRADGEVSTPRPNSEFHLSISIAALHRFGWGNTTRGRDGIDDLFVARTIVVPETMTTQTTAGVLIGDASRVLTMPRFPSPQRPTIGTLAVGRLDGTTVSAAAVRGVGTSSELITYDLESQFASFPLNGIEVDPTEPGTVLRTESAPLIAVRTRSGLAAFTNTGVQCTASPPGNMTTLHAVDLDGDGFDELAASDAGIGRVRVFDVSGGAACSIGGELLPVELVGCFDVARIGTTTISTCQQTTEVGPALYRIVDGGREATPIVELDGTPAAITPGDYDGDGVTDLAIAVTRGGVRSIQMVRQCPTHDTRGCR